jgi:TolB protein
VVKLDILKVFHLTSIGLLTLGWIELLTNKTGMNRFLFLIPAFILLFSCQKEKETVYEAAFVSDRNGVLDIFLTDSDTSFVVALTQTRETEYGMAWSPDGKRLAFSVYSNNKSSIFILDVATGTMKRITGEEFSENGPAFSPDGRKLVFSSNRDHEANELYIQDHADAEWRRLTFNEMYEGGPQISPDGKEIVFFRQISPPDSGQHAGNGEIFLMDLDGQNEKRLTFDAGFDGMPAFSPDGSRIAFHRCAEDSCAIWLIGRDGSGLLNLTPSEKDCRWPRWSPGGEWIAFTRTDGKNTDIWQVRPDGTDMKPFVVSPFRDEILEFRPQTGR